MANIPSEELVVCLDKEGYAASLERRKIYIALPDPDADENGLLRVIDESGEDYPFPTALFRSLPRA